MKRFAAQTAQEDFDELKENMRVLLMRFQTAHPERTNDITLRSRSWSPATGDEQLIFKFTAARPRQRPAGPDTEDAPYRQLSLVELPEGTILRERIDEYEG